MSRLLLIILGTGTLLALLLGPAPSAMADAVYDCPPVGHIPGYVSDPPDKKTFDQQSFRNKDGSDAEVKGPSCVVSYHPAPGKDDMSDLEWHYNYRDQLGKLGAELLYTDDGRTDARLDKNGQTIWIRVDYRNVTTVTEQAFKATPMNRTAKDCPFLGPLAGYEASGPATRKNFDEVTFNIRDGGDVKEVPVKGPSCTVIYTPSKGAQDMTDLEWHDNYRQHLKELNAQIVNADSGRTDARIVQNGATTWIRLDYRNVTTVEEQPFKPTPMTRTDKDCPLLGPLTGYEADHPATRKNFDQASFATKDGDVTVQGAFCQIIYRPAKGTLEMNDLEWYTNYQRILDQMGAETLHADPGRIDARIEKNGQVSWLRLDYRNVTEIDEKAFQASIVAPTPDAMKARLDSEGHIALYINFDFNKATIKPDAKPILDQVVAFMKANPGYKLRVEGHTDNIGGHDFNMKLSQDRAAAVVDALVKAGVDKARLDSAGFGPDKPVVDNKDSMGRAKNRRVELVKD